MQRHKVAIEDALRVDVIPVTIFVIHRRNPFLLILDHPPPETGEGVQVDDEEEDEFVEFKECFKFFGGAKIGNNLAQPHDSHELEGTEELEDDLVTREHQFGECVKRDSRQDVDGELAPEVVTANHLHIFHLGSGAFINVGGPEANYDIDD